MKIFLFSPHAFISVHSLPEALVAEALKGNGHEIIQIGCDGIYEDFCISMSAAGLRPNNTKEQKKQICDVCRLKSYAVQKEFSFFNIRIDDFLTRDDLENIDFLIKSVDKDNYLNFSLEGIPVGRYATYEFLLNEKISTPVLTDIQWLNYLIGLKNSVKTIIAGELMFNRYKPDRLLTYNSLYSVNHIMCALADKYGIPHYSLHAGSHHVFRVSEMTIFKGLISQFLINRSKSWDIYSKIPLSERQINRVVLHIDELLTAKSPWVYSIKGGNKNSKELRQFFGIADSQKVLLITMASADERFAASLVDGLPPYEEPIFKTQIEWIEFIIEWVKHNPEIFAIIRVHPREFPNKRENVLSFTAKELKKYFNELPSNIRVNWPDDNISLHDLIKITDVGLNATSTSGLEMLMFGIPVVIYDMAQLFSYPRELNKCGETNEDYLENIKLALDEGWSVKNVIGVYRWLSYRSEVVAIDLSDRFSVTHRSLVVRGIRKIQRFLNVQDFLPGLVRHRRKPLKKRKWLTFAIENNLDSHIEEYVKSLSVSDESNYALESKIICKQSLTIFQRMGKEDEIFLKKINRLFATTY